VTKEALGSPASGGNGPDRHRRSHRRDGAHVRDRPRDRVSSEAVAAGSLLLDAELDLERMIEQVLNASERLLRDRLPPFLGDLHPDHCPIPTADFNAPPLHNGIPTNYQPS
jgi:hypothetical protein